MGFRDDLDLSKVLKRFDSRGDMVEMALGTEAVIYTGTAHKQEDYSADSMAWTPGQQALNDGTYQPTSNDPFLVGRGPEVASSCVALQISPQWCWDANGYYRDLGVHWRATRKELREGYQRMKGWKSVYLTYVLKQLLKPDVRAAYDRTPLGEPFTDDTYVQDAMKAKASMEASRLTRERGVPVSVKEVLDSQGYDFFGEDEEEEREKGKKVTEWTWAYYLWRARPTESTTRIAAWQTAVISALARRGAEVPVVVGLMGHTAHRFSIGMVGSSNVIFVNDAESITDELADSAVTQFLLDLGIAQLGLTA